MRGWLHARPRQVSERRNFVWNNKMGAYIYIYILKCFVYVCVHRQHDNDHSSAAGRIIYDLELNATAARQSNRSTSRDIRNRRVCVCIMHNIKIKRTSRESSFILMFYFYFFLLLLL